MDCFVIMPFGDPFNEYYQDVLVPAISKTGLQPVRADRIYGVNPIIEDICRRIIGAEVIVADVTLKNPNVNYELGMAHALGKQVVIISQSIEDIPFDYRHIRAIIYNTNDRTWKAKLQTALSQTISLLICDKTSHFVLPPIAELEHGTAHPVVGYWGLNAIYQSRQEMNIRCNELNRELTSILDRDSQTKVITQKVRDGLKLRILTLSSDSTFLAQRELDEKVVHGDIKKRIQDLELWVRKLRKVAPNPHNVQLNYYNSLPLDFYWHQENNLFVGPYLYGIDSQKTITYEFVKGSRGYEYYLDYFDRLWQDPEFCKPIPNGP